MRRLLRAAKPQVMPPSKPSPPFQCEVALSFLLSCCVHLMHAVVNERTDAIQQCQRETGKRDPADSEQPPADHPRKKFRHAPSFRFRPGPARALTRASHLHLRRGGERPAGRTEIA